MSDLQYLFLDPSYGYLYPHSRLSAACGCKENQIIKYRPTLIEGHHWHKIRGLDHIWRIFYTIAGLEQLTQRLATPQAQTFWHLIVQQTQTGGALVPCQPAHFLIEPVEPETELVSSDSVDFPPTHPAYLVVLQPNVDPATGPTRAQDSERSFSPSRTPPPSAQPTLSETAALIFQAQQVARDQMLLAQQVQAQNQPPSLVQIEVNQFQRWNRWVESQDGLAILILGAFLMLMLGLGSYLLTRSLAPSTPQIQPQARLN